MTRKIKNKTMQSLRSFSPRQPESSAPARTLSPRTSAFLPRILLGPCQKRIRTREMTHCFIFQQHRGQATPRASHAGGQASLIAVMLILAISISGVFGASVAALREAKVAEARTRARNAPFA